MATKFQMEKWKWKVLWKPLITFGKRKLHDLGSVFWSTTFVLHGWAPRFTLQETNLTAQQSQLSFPPGISLTPPNKKNLTELELRSHAVQFLFLNCVGLFLQTPGYNPYAHVVIFPLLIHQNECLHVMLRRVYGLAASFFMYFVCGFNKYLSVCLKLCWGGRDIKQKNIKQPLL